MTRFKKGGRMDGIKRGGNFLKGRDKDEEVNKKGGRMNWNNNVG